MIAYQVQKLDMAGCGLKYEPHNLPIKVLKPHKMVVLFECIYHERTDAAHIKNMLEASEKKRYPNAKHRAKFKIVKIEIKEC